MALLWGRDPRARVNSSPSPTHHFLHLRTPSCPAPKGCITSKWRMQCLPASSVEHAWLILPWRHPSTGGNGILSALEVSCMTLAQVVQVYHYSKLNRICPQWTQCDSWQTITQLAYAMVIWPWSSIFGGSQSHIQPGHNCSVVLMRSQYEEKHQISQRRKWSFLVKPWKSRHGLRIFSRIKFYIIFNWFF